jgi:hypothetical protein
VKTLNEAHLAAVDKMSRGTHRVSIFAVETPDVSTKGNAFMSRISINIEGNAALITGSGLDRVRAALTSQSRVITTRAGNVEARGHQHHHYFHELESGGLETALGLVPRLRQALAQEGIAVTTSGVTSPAPSALDYSLCDRTGFPLPIRQLSARLCTFNQGQVLYHNDGDSKQVLATLVRTYATRRILIVGKRRRELKGLAGFLTDATGVQVYSDHKAAFQHGCRKLVATSYQFAAANQDDWDVIVFMSPDAVLGRTSWQTALWLSRHVPMYCLRPIGLHLSHNEQLQLESVCGPVIFTTPGPRGQLADVNVHFTHGPAQCHQIADINRLTTPVERKRVLYWHNQERNQHLANIATALEQASLHKMWELGLFLQESHAYNLPSTIAILVQNIEHGTQLHAFLPHWTLITNNNTPSTANRLIITQLAATHHEISSDALLIASGLPTDMNQLQFPRTLQNDACAATQHVIDLTDDFHPLALQDLKTRIITYLQAGWNVPARNPEY